MEAQDVVQRLARPISEIGRAWMLSPETLAVGAELGLSAEIPFDFWVNGRGGVLGDGDAAKVIAGIAFMGPDLARRYWEERPASLSAIDAAHAYAGAGAAWGRERLGALSSDEALELVVLVKQVCDAAPESIGVLFAGWREVPLSSDPIGAAIVAMNVLRELRGGAHISAVYASGLDPVGAIISTDHPTHGGPDRARRFGWSTPYPNPDLAARERAEALTSTILEPIYARALSASLGARLVALVEKVRGLIDV